MNTLLRDARADDAPAVAALLINTRTAFMPYAPSVHSDSEVRTWAATTLVPAGGVTVAELDGRVVAAMAVSVAVSVSVALSIDAQTKIAWIEQMAVDPALVGRGIGSTLLRHAMQTLPRPLRLYTFAANTGARRFYERHGFVALRFSDGHDNEERCPDVLYELASPALPAGTIASCHSPHLKLRDRLASPASSAEWSMSFLAMRWRISPSRCQTP